MVSLAETRLLVPLTPVGRASEHLKAARLFATEASSVEVSRSFPELLSASFEPQTPLMDHPELETRLTALKGSLIELSKVILDITESTTVESEALSIIHELRNFVFHLAVDVLEAHALPLRSVEQTKLVKLIDEKRERITAEETTRMIEAHRILEGEAAARS